MHNVIKAAGSALFGLALFSCGMSHSDEVCQYSDPVRVKMEIVDVTAGENPGEYEVWVEFDRSSYGSERQSLGELRNETVTTEYLELNPFLREGTILTGYVHEVVEGNCETPPPNFDQGFKSPR